MVLGMVRQYMARICNGGRARPLYLVLDARGVATEGRADAAERWPAARPDSLVNGQRVPSLRLS